MQREPDCRGLEMELTAYLQAELPEERAREVEAHLEHCAACSQAVSDLRSVFTVTAAVEDVTPSLRFRKKIQAILDNAGRSDEKTGILLKLRSAGAFLVHRLRTSPRFRLAAVSAGVHVVLLLALPFVILPGITKKRSGEFTGRFEEAGATVGESNHPEKTDGAPISTDPEHGMRWPELEEHYVHYPTEHPGELSSDSEFLPPIHRLENRLPRPVFANDLVPDRKIQLLASQVGDGEGAYRAIGGALSWLADRQREDGSWAPAALGETTYGTGVTATVLLAFLSDGNSQERGREEWRGTVTRAVDRLLEDRVREGPHQGLIGHPKGHYTYNHALAVLALSEVWSLDRHRMKATRRARLRAAILDAVKFVQRSQTPRGGWRYTLEDARESLPDTSVSIFMMMSLVSARGTGIALPPLDECFSRFTGWLRHVTGARGIVGYQSPDDRADHPRTLTAGALYLEELLGLAAPLRARQAAAVLAELRDPDGSTDRNGLLRFYSALAFRTRGERVLPIFGPRLLAARSADGSWKAAGDLHGFHGGDTFQTALNVLTLTTSYRWAT